MTLLEYFNTPETVLPQELIFGVPRLRDAPFVSHQRAVLRIAMALENLRPICHGEVLIAPVDVVLDVDRALVLQPDIVWVDYRRELIVRERVYGPPDLVVEVLSPRPRIGELEERVRLFLEYGISEIWLYHQTLARFDVLVNQGNGRLIERRYGPDEPIESAVLPGFTSTLTDLVGYQH